MKMVGNVRKVVALNVEVVALYIREVVAPYVREVVVAPVEAVQSSSCTLLPPRLPSLSIALELRENLPMQ